MSQATAPLRIGVIGAGSIFKNRHLPALRKIEGVDFVAVRNRSEESSKQVAEQWGFERTETDWRSIVQADDIDVVMIGTWPYTHKEMSVAALEADKHVFCQARMAMNLAEADDMVAAADEHPGRVSVVCPPPHRMPAEPFVQKLIRDGDLGELREAALHVTGGANLGELSWRERVEFSGQQVLSVGIWSEALIAWLGEYETLSATTATPIASKPDPDNDGKPYTISIPQIVLTHGRLTSGIAISERFSGVSPHDAVNALVVAGSEKSLRVRIQGAHMKVDLANAGEKGPDAFKEVEPPAELTNPWRVEQDFVDAVRMADRGEDWRALPSTTPDFHEAHKYMKKIDAIHRSASTGQAVQL
ncbi:MAG: Gfo/Idh/MocA family protein [Phycisphaeraceae bacterium]